MITVTSDDIPGMTITSTQGIVYGNSVRARNIGRDITATFRNIVGGEVPEYAQLMARSRQEALGRMTARAEEMGANRGDRRPILHVHGHVRRRGTSRLRHRCHRRIVSIPL